jgi:hypothetical protein
MHIEACGPVSDRLASAAKVGDQWSFQTDRDLSAITQLCMVQMGGRKPLAGRDHTETPIQCKPAETKA